VDFAVYLRVLWRFRVVVAAGAALALALALLSGFRIDFDGVAPAFTHRDKEVWASSSTLFVTQEGFPWGRAILDETIKVQGGNGTDASAYVPRYGDAGRYSGLAQLYVALATSDKVRFAVLRRSPPGSSYQADVVKSADGGTVLPMIYMSGFAASPRAAVDAANVAASAFRRFLAQEQEQNLIPQDKRVRVYVVSRASQATVFQPRSLTRPIFIFLLVFGAFIGLAFVLENLRPEITYAREVEPVGTHPSSARRSA
jgi:hypothetical protein